MTEILKPRFNLIDEPWIPVADKGLASLMEVFTDTGLPELGGNPLQKIAITKLLLAIAQAAITPEDQQHWEQLGVAGISEKVARYLSEKHDLFFLYGPKPFLQFIQVYKLGLVNSELKSKKKKSEKPKARGYNLFAPEYPNNNTTILFDAAMVLKFTDYQKAQILITIQGHALAGKQNDPAIVLSPNHQKKGGASPGTGIDRAGLLHTFLGGSSVIETVWLNLLTREQIRENNLPEIGVPPWEHMPTGEIDERAEKIKTCYTGRLVPLNRFCYLTEDRLFCTEGIVHPFLEDGHLDISAAADRSKSNWKALWTDAKKRPWRELASLLSYVYASEPSGYECHLLTMCLPRARNAVPQFQIWSGGLGVQKKMDGQNVSGKGDFVDSSIQLDTTIIQGGVWFKTLQNEIQNLEKLSGIIYKCTAGYYTLLTVDGSNHAAAAANLFWQKCEPHAQELIDACASESEVRLHTIKKAIVHYAHQCYNRYCPHDTARQLDAWAANRPNLKNFLPNNKLLAKDAA